MERIREAAHEVQRPVFYAIAIIVTAYLPIFTLQRVEGKLFKPMAWTVAFALLGALIFSMLVAPALASILFRSGVKEWRNPVMSYLDRSLPERPSRGRSAIGHSLYGSSSHCFVRVGDVLGFLRGHWFGVSSASG